MTEFKNIAKVTVGDAVRTAVGQGYGKPAILSYHTNFLDLSREYNEADEILSDGFTTASPEYALALAIKGAPTSPESFKLLRRGTAYTQTVEFVPTITTTGYVYSLSIVSPAGVKKTVTYTVVALDTVALIIDALKIAIDALLSADGFSSTYLTCTDGTTKMTLAAVTAGKLFLYGEICKGLSVKDVTADPGLAADLAAVRAVDDDWYALILDSSSKAEVDAIDAVIEAADKMLGFSTYDTECKSVTYSGSATDIGAVMKTAARNHIWGFWAENAWEFPACALFSKCLPYFPGRETWAYKDLTGITPSELTATEEANLKARSMNWLHVTAKLRITETGNVFSGEWIDTVRGISAFAQEISLNMFGNIASSPKKPFTERGVTSLEGDIKAAIDLYSESEDGNTPGLLARDPKPLITRKKVSSYTAAQKKLRKYANGFKVNATLSGAIHFSEVELNVTT